MEPVIWGHEQVEAIERCISNGLMVLQPVAVAGHVDDLAAVDQAVEDGGGDGGVAKEVGPLVKALVGGDDEGSPLAHGGDESKEEIGLSGREGHEAHLVHHYEDGFVEIHETALAGAGDLCGLEDGHECVQRLKGHGVAQIKAADGQGEGEMGLAHAGGTQEADVERLLHPGHVGQAEHLLPGDAALEAEVEGFQRLFSGEVGPLSAQKVLLEDAEALLLGQEQLHGFQRGNMTIQEALRVLESGDWWHYMADIPTDSKEHDEFHTAFDRALPALRAQQEAEKNEPLTLNELLEMDGQPVWFNDSPNGWKCVIINLKFPVPNGRIWFTQCGVDAWGRATSLPLLAEIGVYRRPPEGDCI